jgi:hypothetical protein
MARKNEGWKGPKPCEADAFHHWKGIVAEELFRIEPDLTWISIFSDDQ